MENMKKGVVFNLVLKWSEVVTNSKPLANVRSFWAEQRNVEGMPFGSPHGYRGGSTNRETEGEGGLPE